jgi:ADP-ribose pyrophosphatase
MRIALSAEHSIVHRESLPSSAEQEYFLAQGLSLDMAGRPLHPWAGSLSKRGAPVGKGTFYHWGPNKTVDPIVVTTEARPRILLIRRHDTGEWALPGGFIDRDESTTHAAQRELHEETSLLLSDTQWRICYSGPVDDPRSTLNAWTETTALVTQVASYMEPTANDDALHAEWIALENVPSMNLYGSHKALIGHGLRYISP